MAIVYADYALGNDTSGDGSAGAPYKTFTKATTGLTSADEVRFGYTEFVTLSGTLTFTNDSHVVNTSVDLRSEVSIYDLIKNSGDDEAWWSVSGITATTMNVYAHYRGNAGSGRTAYRMRPIAITGTYDEFKSLGTSESSRLKISGGWDLSNQTQVGYSAIGKLNDTYGIRFDANDWPTDLAYLEISYFVLRVLDLEDAHGCYVHHCYLHDYWMGVGSRGVLENIMSAGADVDIDGGYSSWSGTPFVDRGQGNNVIRDSIFYSAQIDTYSFLNYFERCQFYGDDQWACIYVFESCNNYFKDCVFDTLADNTCGMLYFEYACYGNILENCTFRNSIGYGAMSYDSYGYNVATFIDCTFENNTVGDLTVDGNGDDDDRYGYKPIFTVQNTTGDSYRMYKSGGRITSTATGSITGKCLRFSPTIPFFDLQEIVGAIKINNTSSDIDLNIYMKKDGSFAGEVWLMVVRGGCHLGLTPITLTTDFAMQTVTIDTADLVANEYLNLWVVIQGSAGNVFADDFSAVQQ